MNIQDYIASGILEAYVQGELSGQELAEVEKKLAIHAELRNELERIEMTHEKILRLGAVSPRFSLKQEILETLDKKKAEEDKKIIPFKNQSELKLWRFIAAASVTITLLTGYASYTFWNKWKSSEANLSELVAQNQRVASDYSITKLQLNKLESDLQIIHDDQFNRILLKGTDNAPESAVHIYWNQRTHEVYLSIQHLSQLPSDKQYQLWAIVNGTPVDAGVFDLSTGNLIRMKEIDLKVASFAITVEPTGGKSKPTLETLQVIGNV